MSRWSTCCRWRVGAWRCPWRPSRWNTCSTGPDRRRRTSPSPPRKRWSTRTFAGTAWRRIRRNWSSRASRRRAPRTIPRARTARRSSARPVQTLSRVRIVPRYVYTYNSYINYNIICYILLYTGVIRADPCSQEKKSYFDLYCIT